jgi:hypothetical protein
MEGMDLLWVVATSSHGDPNVPMRPVAVATDQETAWHVAGLLTTCTYCAVAMRVRPDVPVLPATAGRWSRLDVEEWLRQAG